MTDVQLGILLRSYLVRLEAEIAWLDGELGPDVERPSYPRFVPDERPPLPGLFEEGWAEGLAAMASINGEWVVRPGQAAMLDGLQAIIDELAAAVERLLPEVDGPAPATFAGLEAVITSGHRP